MTIHLGQEEFLIHHRRLKSHGWSISGKPIFVGILSEKIFWLVGMPDPVLGGEDLRLRGPQTECDPHLGGTRRLSQAESICPVAHREGGVHHDLPVTKVGKKTLREDIAGVGEAK
jgi:hypothetical protein